MSQLGEQTQEDSAEDLDEDSAEDTKEESNEDLNEDSKEEKEDTDEELNEDLEEEKEDSDEELNEDSEEELDEDLEEEKEDSDEDLNEDSEEELDEDLEEERESGFIDTPTGALYDTPEGIFSLPEPTGIEDSDLTNLEEEREFEIPEGFREIPEGIEHLDVPESSELSLPEPTGIEPSDLTNLDADASDVPSDVIDIPEGTELSLPEPTGIEPSDLFNLDANASDVPSDVIDIPEGTELSLPELIGIEASDLSNLDANASEGVTEHSEINSYTENNEGTTTCLLINEQEESNELACESQEETAIKDTLENELSNELQADTTLQDSLENELTAQDTLENELPSELQDGSTLQDELSELDENLSELEDTSSSELREYPFIQDVLENELSELDGELSELKDISSSGLQEAPVMQDVLEDEIGDELTHSEKESWDLKDMFLNEFVDLSDTQYSLEEASLEISNAMEPMALDIANVHTKTFRQDYVGDPQIENVFEEENENEINYDLSIDKNNQEASEQELSLIGKESGEESKEITAATSSTTSTDQKDNQEDHKESEPTSERNEESHNNNDIKDSEKDSENLNKETDEDVKLEGEESEDLEDLIDKAKEEFKIFKDPKLKELIKKHDGVAYKGTHFTKKFIKFIKDQDNDTLTKKEKYNLLKRIDEFNESKIITNLLKYYIRYTKISQNKVREKLEEMNLKISKYTLTKISHKVLTQKEYEERFTKPGDWVSDEQREGIIKDGRSKNPISVTKIAETWGVGWGTARDIIKKDLGEKEYHKKFPYPEVSDEQRKGIIKAGRSKNPISVTKIAETWRVGWGTARDIIKKDLGEKEYHKKFPKLEVSDEQREGIIKAGHSENPDSIGNIAVEWGVSITSALNIIRDDLGEKVYHKKFPEPADWVSDEQREGIIKAGRSKDLDSIDQIAETWEVAYGTAASIIRDDLGEKEFNKKFHNDIPQLIGLENHKLIEKIATQDFDEKRKKSPDVPILISEAKIYTNSRKYCDNAFKNDKKYLQKLLKDRIAKELKIDPKKLDDIKVVLFDYTRSIRKKTIMDKIKKYQHSRIMLFIVGTYWFQNWISRFKKLPKDKRIKYPENIRIIKWDLFADLLNLSDDNRKRLKEIIELSRLKDLETLRRLNEQNNYKLHRLKKSKTRKKGSKNNLDAFLREFK